jgi:hypothetical protein
LVNLCWRLRLLSLKLVRLGIGQYSGSNSGLLIIIQTVGEKYQDNILLSKIEKMPFHSSYGYLSNFTVNSIVLVQKFEELKIIERVSAPMLDNMK